MTQLTRKTAPPRFQWLSDLDPSPGGSGAAGNLDGEDGRPLRNPQQESFRGGIIPITGGRGCSTGRKHPFRNETRIAFSTWRDLWLDAVAPAIGEWDEALWAVAQAVAGALSERTLSAILSLEETATAAGVSRVVARRCLRDLESGGFLMIDRGNGRGLKSILIPVTRRDLQVVGG